MMLYFEMHENVVVYRILKIFEVYVYTYVWLKMEILDF